MFVSLNAAVAGVYARLHSAAAFGSVISHSGVSSGFG